MSANDGSNLFLRLGKMIPRVLMAAGSLAAVSCAKISLPQNAQEQAAPAPSPTAGQNTYSFLPSFDNPPAPVKAALSSFLPSPTPAPAPASAPAQVATLRPHPAAGAKEAAMKMYPQLAVKDSTFNKVFRDLYTEELQKNPESLTKADWPLTLARRTADILAKPVASSAPPASVIPGAPAPGMDQAQPIRATPTPPTSLNRGAYNQTRSPYWWYGPWVRYY